MLIDLCILVLPLPMLWGLQAGRGKKLLVMGVFVCGYWYVLFLSTPVFFEFMLFSSTLFWLHVFIAESQSPICPLSITKGIASSWYQ